MVVDKNRIAYLISEVVEEDSAGFESEVTEIKTQVWCAISSVTGQEYATMGQNNIRPAMRITVWAHEYNGEEIVEVDGKRYGVYRLWQKGSDDVDLYLEKKAGVKRDG